MSANTSEPTHCPAPDNTAPNIGDVRDISFGTHIESLAAYWGVQPVDAALGIAGVLTNIAGPYAGLIDPLGNRIQPHLNLIKVNNTSPRWPTMESAIFQPLQARSDYLRKRASCQSRQLADRWAFGKHNLEAGERITHPLLQDFNVHDARSTELQTALLKQGGLPSRCLDARDLAEPYSYPTSSSPEPSTLGPTHLPSWYFTGTSLESLGVILTESLHRQAFVRNPTGGLFSPGEELTSKDQKLAAELASLLGGRDKRFAPIHRDQGYGQFEMARLHLWASTTSERLGQIIDQPKSVWPDVLKHCLLWEPSARTESNHQISTSPAAYKAYQAIVHDLLDRRCFGNIREQSLREIPDQARSRFVTLQNTYLDFLEGMSSPDNAFTEQFYDLPGRLLWVFLLFEVAEKPWRMRAAFKTAEHAVRMQLRLMQRVRDEEANKKRQQVRAIVTGILVRKGPCKMRDIQRSCNNRNADHFRPVLRELEKEGHLRVDDQNRFTLIGQSGAHSN